MPSLLFWFILTSFPAERVQQPLSQGLFGHFSFGQPEKVHLLLARLSLKRSKRLQEPAWSKQNPDKNILCWNLNILAPVEKGTSSQQFSDAEQMTPFFFFLWFDHLVQSNINTGHLQPIQTQKAHGCISIRRTNICVNCGHLRHLSCALSLKVSLGDEQHPNTFFILLRLFISGMPCLSGDG